MSAQQAPEALILHLAAEIKVLRGMAEHLLSSMELISTAKDRGFGIDYATGCARVAVEKAKRAAS